MSTHLQDKVRRLEEIIQRLTEESTKGIPIVVEGKKDVQTLKALGIMGPMITTKTAGKSRLDVLGEIEKAGAKEAILLLDFDRQGKRWMRFLREHMEKTRMKPRATFYAELFGLVGRELKDVEGLASYMETLKSKIPDS